jgi:hypothetical protein
VGSLGEGFLLKKNENLGLRNAEFLFFGFLDLYLFVFVSGSPKVWLN